MKKIVVLIVTLVALTGCGTNSSSKDRTTVCKNDQPYLMYESGDQTLISKGDRVQAIKTKAILDVKDKDTADEIEENFEELISNLVSSEGVKFSMERIDDTRIYDMSEIDLKLADMEELSDLGLIQMDDEAQKIGYVSLKKSISFLEEMGFVCDSVK